MKRFLILALVAAFVLGAGLARAGEVEMQGQFQQNFEWTDNTDFFDYDHQNTSEDDFDAWQRIRVYFHYVANENLKGVFGIESTNTWGEDTAGPGWQGSLGSNPATLSLKHGYIDFNLPGTMIRVRSGMQYFEPPSTMGSPIFNDDVFGISASYTVNDMLAVTAAWHRLWDQTTNADPVTGSNENDEMDLFFLSVPVTMDGFTVNPYLIYAHQGANCTAAANPVSPSGGLSGLAAANATGGDIAGNRQLGDDLDIWWGGASFTMDMFDPFMVKADLIYGSVDGSNNSRDDREGWFFDLGVDYKMDMVTPGLFFFWGSGDDDDPSNGSERMPSLGTGINGGACAGFGPTSFGTDGSKGSWGGRDKLLLTNDYAMWAIGGKLADFSFLENLSHTLRVVYGEGTNDPDLAKKGYATGLTQKDSFWEVNVDSAYSMYENLTAYLEIGYIALDLDDEPWKNTNTGRWAGDPDNTDDAWKCGFTLQYNF